MKAIKTCILIICIGVVHLTQGQNVQKIVCDGSINQLDSLIKSGFEVNTQDKRGLTALHYAVACNKIKMVQLLIDKGANPNTMDKRKYSPLYFAAAYDRPKIVNMLMEAGAKPSIGPSPIFYAVLNDNLTMLKKLVTPEIDIDAKNRRGNTALAMATRQDSKEMVKFLLSKGADKSTVPTFNLRGKYVGQTEPGLEAKMFAPNFVSTESFNHTPSFTPDGKTLYFTTESRKYPGGRIMMTRIKNGKWTDPKQAFAKGEYREFDSFVTRDGTTMYYCSNRPRYQGDTTKSVDMWMVKRKGKKWGKPIHLGNEINTKHQDWFPTLSDKGTLVFSNGPRGKSKIYYATLKNGQYQKGIAFSDSINSPHQDYDPIIAPDESFLIFSSRRPGGYGSVDLYISFKKPDGTWTQAKNMGKAINTKQIEFAPTLSPDGKYLFFNRGGDIFWVSTEVIKNLKSL